MKIKWTTNEIIEKYKEIEEFVQNDKEIPLELAWDLEENQEEFKAIVEKFERYRADIIQKLQEHNVFEITEDNKTIVREEHIKEFQEANEKVDKLLAIENEIEVSTYEKDKGLPKEMSVKDIRAIKFMLV
jgi:hypothetical protein|uniref:Uncharacterized protein n=1 Tax=Phage sp. ctGns7 TaxID=2828003 RepID=A0A8S5S9T4_9VIRU|nr:MAG TPA: Protein of unknown function (DUF1617) [Phage sp. ctGns7]